MAKKAQRKKKKRHHRESSASVNLHVGIGEKKIRRTNGPRLLMLRIECSFLFGPHIKGCSTRDTRQIFLIRVKTVEIKDEKKSSGDSNIDTSNNTFLLLNNSSAIDSAISISRRNHGEVIEHRSHRNFCDLQSQLALLGNRQCCWSY